MLPPRWTVWPIFSISPPPWYSSMNDLSMYWLATSLKSTTGKGCVLSIRFGIEIPAHAKISYRERSHGTKKLPKEKKKLVSKHILKPMCRELIKRVVPGASKNDMILEVGNDLVRSIGDDDSDVGGGSAKEFDKLMSAAVRAYSNASKGSIEKRTARAILYCYPGCH